ncbi:MAG: FAD-dependent oxidoreductase [Candidatus Helarchaeota archaeon]|nr:FAD-dependent oxidoreductase [Candidatus Helarchaeota archaeon]
MVEEDPITREIILYYEDKMAGESKEARFDLVVLSAGYQPSKDNIELCEKLGVKLNKYYFSASSVFTPLETNVPGIYACGTFSGPKDIPETVAEASGVAAKASALLASERNNLTTKKTYPPEIPVRGEEPRIGVFICHCGINIGGVVDVPEVVEFAETLPKVVYAERNLYTCSQDTQDKIKQIIKDQNINRVIVASCTPRTHESLFQNTIREAGLNRYLFELVNIREHCSWVHMREPNNATAKAKKLVAMTVAKAQLFQPVSEISVDITQVGLVVGGGIAGLTAALELADQGYDVYLIEKGQKLGGLVKKIHYILEDDDPQAYLKKLIDRVNGNDKITVLLNTAIEDITGYVGNFKIKTTGEMKELETGIIIVATGGFEYKPTEYLYGQDERILTQQEFEQKIVQNEVSAKKIVMIQCVGSRNEVRPYCSKICCSIAIKNALKLKSLDLDTQVFILYRDIRTYGFKEEYYEKARELGVNFIQYEENRPPEIDLNDNKIQLSIFNLDSQSVLQLEPDLVVLSAAFLPTENKDLAQMLKVPLDQNGFFLEAHAKLRPLDFATDGIFLCGAAQWPKFINETIAQAKGAAARATTILSKEKITVIGATAKVNEDLCIGCGNCQEICPYGAIEMRLVESPLERTSLLTYQSHVLEAVCKGCGACSATCPVQAINTPHFTNTQILEMVKTLTKKAE